MSTIRTCILVRERQRAKADPTGSVVVIGDLKMPNLPKCLPNMFLDYWQRTCRNAACAYEESWRLPRLIPIHCMVHGSQATAWYVLKPSVEWVKYRVTWSVSWHMTSAPSNARIFGSPGTPLGRSRAIKALTTSPICLHRTLRSSSVAVWERVPSRIGASAPSHLQSASSQTTHNKRKEASLNIPEK